VIYIEGQNLFFAAVMCYYSPPPPLNNVSVKLTANKGGGGGAQKIIKPIYCLSHMMKHQGKNITDPENIE
jgi:hypothetical protein